MAHDSFLKGGINRVILGTDGDFNVGIRREGELVRLIEQERKGGVFLSILGPKSGILGINAASPGRAAGGFAS